MQTFKYSAGETILSEGDVGHSAYLISRGSVEVIIGKDEKARRIATMDAGEIFGEMSLIDPGPRSATVKALSDTECLVATYDEFVASIQQHPEQAVEFMKALVRRLRHMNLLVANLAPGKRRLRDIFVEWQTKVFEDSDEVRHQVNKTFV